MNYSRGKILNRHRHVEPQLDLIRIGVVASLKTAGVASAHQGIRWPWMALWEEILWPCRRILQAAASMWLLIASINFIALNPSTTQPIHAAKADRKYVLAMLAEQRSLIESSELPAAPNPAPPPSPTPSHPSKLKPRSQLNHRLFLA